MDLVIDREFVPEEFFDTSNVINEKLISVKRLVRQYNQEDYMSGEGQTILKKLLKSIGKESSIVPPF